MKHEKYPLAVSESVWANSIFSIVRHTGQIKVGPYLYVICNKDGKDIFECSMEAEKAGRKKAIEPGEPCDLVRTDVLPFYRKLGRDGFLHFCKSNPDCWTLKQVKERLKQWQQLEK